MPLLQSPNFLLVVNVPLTGLTLHDWLGILVGIGFIIHLQQHGEWIATTTRRFMSASSFQNRVNYLLMAGLFVGFATIIVSGLLISEVALPWIGFTPGGGTFWLWIHLASVGWVIWLTAIHIAMNWRWIGRSVRLQADLETGRPPMTVIRRVVIVLILGVAVTMAWAWIARTPWAATVDVLTAGEQFTDWVEPFRMIAGTLLVAVPAVLLIHSGWSWVSRNLLGKEPARQIPVEHPRGGR